MAGYNGRPGFNDDTTKSVNGTAYNSQAETQRNSRITANTAQNQRNDLGVYATSDIFLENGFNPQDIMQMAKQEFLVNPVGNDQNPDFSFGFNANSFTDLNGKNNIKEIIENSNLTPEDDDKPYLGLGPNLVIQDPDEVSDGNIDETVRQLGFRNRRGRGFGWTNDQKGTALGAYFERSYSMTGRSEDETEGVVKGERIAETPVDYDPRLVV